ncbi:MAG: class I SAM-dependent rRNA methyltransferase [Paracoccaceae bacterium]|nr:class I SAM-dependent rRNA methyltransferase [Paracoccaceae bacterium]MDG2259306.1 class I SAM-dependent rRNA methyltransferase [Paracoccaceae bacterium]
MTQPSLPIVRLKPKTKPQVIRHGFPWVYDNEIVTDRRTKNLEPGAVAILEDAERNPLALVAINPNSKIFCRVLDRDLTATIDQAWFEARLTKALVHRETLFDAPFYRLIHAEADGMPGVIIDRFGDTAVVQPNAAWADVRIDDLCTALIAVTGVINVLVNASGRARTLEGLDDEARVISGQAPETPLQVPMNGALYLADLIGGQKTGLFYDQRPNHAFAASLANGKTVLDVFSHVGGFSLACLAGGATNALAVDGSANALELAQGGADAGGFDAKFETRKGDAFATLETLADEGQTFDIVVCDPPAFAPNRKALDAGLRAYERIARLAAPLVAENGYLVLCSCSHAADLQKFRTSCVRGIGRANRQAQLIHTGYAGADHPLMPQLAESGYLKSLFFRL